MNFFSKLFQKEPTIKFKSYIGNFAIATPVVAAGKLRAKWMIGQPENKKFQQCPGMLDYSNAGYIITAHTDIHIKANAAGIVVKIEQPNVDARALQPTNFEFALVDGMAPINGVKKHAGKLPLPWSVQAKAGYSAHVIPAVMHSDFLDKLFVYPGITDFDKFHVINFVFSPIKECEFTIYAGTPLLQVIPFKREIITAECDKATVEEIDQHLFNFPSRIKHYYRRFLSGRKSYTMKCPYNHRG